MEVQAAPRITVMHVHHTLRALIKRGHHHRADAGQRGRAVTHQHAQVRQRTRGLQRRSNGR